VKVNVSPEVALAEDDVSAVAVTAATRTAGATVTKTAFETEAARFDVPPKLASIESAPLGRVDRLIVATPPLTVPVPMKDPPLRKVTTPEVAGLLSLDTVAVKVTLEPNVGPAEDEISVVVVASGDTDTTTGAELDGDKLDVPTKLALIKFEPTGSVVRFNVATPLLMSPVPMADPPSRNVTVPPVTVTLPFSTEAVKTALEPNAGWVEDALSVVVV